MQDNGALAAPQFKTWLYIYRNNSVRDEFRNTLRTDYHVEVKDIDRYDTVGWGDDDAAAIPSKTVNVIEKPTDKDADKISQLMQLIDPESITDPDNSKDIVEFDTLKVNNSPDDDATRLIDDQRDASKFDEVVEDKQYVEVPLIREQIAAQQQKQDIDCKKQSKHVVEPANVQKSQTEELPATTNNNKKMIDAVKQSIIAENNQYVPESVVIVEQLKETAANIKESLKQPLKTADATTADFESLEIMDAQPASTINDRFNVAREFGAQNNGEVASVLSGNSIVGKKTDASAGDFESKLILFNGLYYRGSWQTPFQQLRSEIMAAGNTFYKSDTEKCAVHMMRARGQFKYASLKDAKSQAIELPYDVSDFLIDWLRDKHIYCHYSLQNDRYTLLIIVPNSRSGLAALQNEITADTVRETSAQLSARSVELSVPKFNIETTGGIEQILASKQPQQQTNPIGQLIAIFTDQADFSGITDEQKLHIEELQQHVSVRIDEGASSENFLTATNSLRSAAAATETQSEENDSNNKAAETTAASTDEPTPLSVVIDRPFLFFVRDVIDDVLIVAGKVVEPPTNDDPVSLLLD